LELRPSGADAITGLGVLPAEGSARDADGVLIYYLLHTDDDDMLAEFEEYKADGTDIIRRPDPADVEILVFPWHWDD
jgi:hypothetical protein